MQLKISLTNEIVKKLVSAVKLDLDKKGVTRNAMSRNEVAFFK